ncbi:HIT family protein [Burkholderiales bacterium]|mgnify:FL=1|nr:HIT family protein [Burkholderiales bacterium]
MSVAGCLFCDLQTSNRERIVSENKLAFAVRDGFPVAEGHTLIIPKRHTLDYFELVPDEVLAVNELIHEQRVILLESDQRIEGFNIGMNCGLVAGQSVWHCHIHLIPRRKGDSKYPKGGVRHVIPYEGDYEDLR